MTLLELVTDARKFFTALVAASGVAALALADNSISPTEWLQIGVAFLGALGVYVVSNKKDV